MTGRHVVATAHKGGCVVELNGKYWSDGWNDGYAQMDRGFGPLEKASIHDPRYLHTPESVVHPDAIDAITQMDLHNARLLPIVVTTITTVWTPKEEAE